MSTKSMLTKVRFIKRLVAVLLLSLPLSAAQAALTLQNWQTPQGARVIFVESHELPMLDISVDFSSGSARDPVDKPGLARLAHGMLDQGAGGLSDTEIAHRLADVGAELQGHFDRDRAGVTLRTLSSAAEKDKALVRLNAWFEEQQKKLRELGASDAQYSALVRMYAAKRHDDIAAQATKTSDFYLEVQRANAKENDEIEKDRTRRLFEGSANASPCRTPTRKLQVRKPNRTRSGGGRRESARSSPYGRRV